MGFLNFHKSTPSHSQIIYTDNVRRKSSFSLIVTDSQSADGDFKDIYKHIATFEENADADADSGKGVGNFVTDKNGNFMIVTELGANFIFQEGGEEDESKTIQVPTTHRWVVFTSAFFILMVDMGFVYSFGTLFPVILEEFGDSRASTAAIQSVFTGVGLTSGLVTGGIAQRFGPRKCGCVGGAFLSVGLLSSYFATSTVYLQVSYGVVSALGFSLLYISSNTILSQLFTGQIRIVCLALAAMAPGVGGVIYPYLLLWLAEKFGLKGTLLLVGGAVMNTVPLATLWSIPQSKRHNKVDNKNNNQNINEDPAEKSKQNVQRTSLIANTLNIVKYKPFLFVFMGLGLTMSTINIFGILNMDIYKTNGLSADQSITAVIVSNSINMPSRLIPALVNRIQGYSSIMSTCLAALLGATGMVLLTLVPSFTGNMLASGLIGIARGCCVGCFSLVTIKVLDVKRFSTGLGLIFGIIGVITTITGPIYGFIRDVSGSYNITLYTTTVALLIGCVFCTISLILNSRAKAQRKRERSMSVFTVTRF